jgi:cystathionine beta-lyase family protein involved in aluminum resistance
VNVSFEHGKQTEQTMNAADQALMEKANRIGAQAVGQQFTIKLSESSRANRVTVTGTIVECGFGYFRNTRTKQQAIFKVVMACGPNKVLRTFHVQRVPQ